jgi:two-component system cell cycle sensor histidine kinase/response regulator CckA
MTILLFDAGISGSAPLRAALHSLGHDVEVTNNPAWPLDGHDLSIVWTGQDLAAGVRLIRELRAAHRVCTPILAIGPFGASLDVTSILEAGAGDFLPFPADPGQLAARLLVLQARNSQIAFSPDQLSDRLAQVHSYEILATMLGRVAHDYNNLLAAIQGNAELSLLGSKIDPATRHGLEQIRSSAGKAIDLTRQLQSFSKSSSGAGIPLPLDLTALVRDSAQLLRAAVSRACRLHYDLPSGFPLISGDASRLRQALCALAINASEALGPDGGDITFRVFTRQQSVVLEVQDSGPGISPELRDRVFDPFFSTKEPGRGLGLAAVKAIARAHSASLEVAGGPGAIFQLAFPSVAPASLPPTKPRGTVLLIDEDDATRAAAHRHLRRAGFVVFESSSAAEGLELMGQIASVLDALVLDPDAAGLDDPLLLAEILGFRPDGHLVLWSAAPEETLRRRLPSVPGFAFAPKPNAADLAGVLARACTA